MKITSIKQQVKDPRRVSIFVDEKYSFALPLNELADQKLKKGQEVSEADVSRLKRLSEDAKLKAKALNWVLIRPHSEREFKDYLKRKKAEPDLVENWTAEFRDRKYLDDRAFALWFSDNRSRKNKSNRAIKAELFSKGVSRQVVEETMTEADSNEEERLGQLIKKKSNSSRYKADPDKLIRYLLQQGFSWAMVKQQLKNNSPED